MKTIDLSEVSEVPVLVNKNAFTGILVDYDILVSRNMLNAFKNASNWSNSSVVNHIKAI